MAPRRARGAIVLVALGVAVAAAHAASGAAPLPRLTRVLPSSAQVPANLLRISIEFAVPVAGPVLPRLGLLHADASPIAQPFLQQELWSPDGKVLTVMLHPGRVKTGLDAHERLGPILRAGEAVTLALDGRAIRQWTVVPDDRDGPVASAWKLSTVHAGSRQPLVVALDGPLDGRSADYVAVADGRGRRVAGQARLTEGESRWTFTPGAPWRAADYRLVVRGTLEDPSGNRLGSRFERPADAPEGPAADAAIDFPVRR